MNAAMKPYIIGALLLASVYQVSGWEIKNTTEQYIKCQKELGFDGSVDTINVEGAPTEAKCFLKCVMLNKEVMNKDGTVDMDHTLAYLDELKFPPERNEKETKAIKTCIAEHKPDPKDLCETAYKYFQCRNAKLKASS